MEKKNSGKILTLVKDYNSFLIAIALLLFGIFFVDGFKNSLDRILSEASMYGMFAVGLGVVMITGNIDLSVGFQAASAAIIAVKMTDITNGNFFLVFLTVVAFGALCGCINGISVIKLKISPLIATIATTYIFKGFTYYFTRSGAIYPSNDYRKAFQNAFAKHYFFDSKALSLTFILMLVIMAFMYFIMRKTRFGVSLYIAGDNPEAGSLAGINIKRTGFMAYIICGICCALAGLFLASRSSSAIYSQGEGRDVFAISACVIGGIKMAGGKGNMLNILFGIFIMRIISFGMDMALVPTAWVDFVSGVLLIVILILDRLSAVKKNED